MAIPAALIPLLLGLAARPAWEGVKSVDNFADNAGRQFFGQEFNPFGMDLTPNTPYQPVVSSTSVRPNGLKGLIDFGSGPLGMPSFNPRPVYGNQVGEFLADAAPVLGGIGSLGMSGALGAAGSAAMGAGRAAMSGAGGLAGMGRSVLGSASVGGRASAAAAGARARAAGGAGSVGDVLGSAARGAGRGVAGMADRQGLIADPDRLRLYQFLASQGMGIPNPNVRGPGGYGPGYAGPGVY